MTTFDARLSSYSSPLLSLFRIIAGLLFTLHGTMKMFGWPIGEAVPVGTWPLWWAGLIELVAGLLITVGLFTRIAAFIAAGEMAVAYFWMHWPPLDGPPASFWPIENGGEATLLYCFGFLALAGLGAGALSVDTRRGGGPGGARPSRVATGTAAPTGHATDEPVRRRGLLSRFRR
ncbi:DoxX family protein [Mycolicibacterium sp. ND9-15]|uniref:DoxX family protein n=1 Tax=Mycolicibacterium sp. ND9-15 TaxID=3042320 RepID=UPI002DDB9C00|nr:DoxX family protein [Mycolicibacterium sp. ND9-15]WSE55984.1 DoxX family protein [Mycolicibacterium sp. ND9-15]